MNFLTVDEYLVSFPQKPHVEAYLKRERFNPNNPFPPREIKLGMLKWNDEDACCWGGPYEGNYAFCRILDHSLTVGKLKSLAEIVEHWKTYETYSMFNVQRSTLKNYFPELVSGYFILKTSTGESCSRSSFTHQELLHYLKSASKEELEYREQTIKEAIEASTYKELSIELPVEFHLSGNDDTSYTAYLATEEEALNLFNHIVDHQPDWEWLQENFVFTN